jgi:Mrp family chromosome partitioning ATPase
MLSDPILLGEKLDGILFLVGLGKVSRELAPQACRRIKATGVDVLGLICNQVNFPSRLNDYGYEYGYYYHYAYANASAYGPSRYSDTYHTDRFVRDGSGSAVQSYHDEGVSRELRQSKSNPANAATLSVISTDHSEDVNPLNISQGPDVSSEKPHNKGGSTWLNKLRFRR